ncbi:hypothetical protein [Azospirillum doebereinerae]
MSDTPRNIVERFPDLAHAIKQYSSDNRFFGGLCDEYDEAVQALLHWEASHTPQAARRAEDYRALVTDLEQEVLYELQRWVDRA